MSQDGARPRTDEDRPQVDQTTADSMRADPDFAGEHEETSLADQGNAPEGPDESVPDGRSGMDSAVYDDPDLAR